MTLKIVASNTLDDVARCGLVYLATPYSKYKAGLEVAHHDASVLAARLRRCGLLVFAPIPHSHSIAIHGKLDPKDHAIWIPLDEEILRRCDVLLIAKFDGWDKSEGVLAERNFARGNRMPIYYINPDTLDVTRDHIQEAA